MSLSDKEVLQLAKALDKILEARENAWIEINNVMMYKILEAFSEQLAAAMKVQFKVLVKLITGREPNDSTIDEESERFSKMMMEGLKKR